MRFHFLHRENGKQTNRINQSSANCPDPRPSWSDYRLKGRANSR